MKIFLFNSGWGADYLADLVGCQLITHPDIEIYCNLIENHLFFDYPPEKHVYGKGFTVFKKLNPEFKNKIKLVYDIDFEELFSQKYFDKIVYTSVRRRSQLAQVRDPDCVADYFDIVSKYYSKEEIFAFDGEDETHLVEKVVPYVTYFKRELLEKDANRAYPTSFTFPAYHQIPEKVDKEYLLAPCDPRFGPSYKYETEESYYLQYSKALFGFTKKKAGWDCMRHYEILACNCIPYFPDIKEKPSTIMKTYPVDLQIKANELFEKMSQSIISFDMVEWNQINDEFQKWFNENSKSKIYENLLF
jgi:hypothetical protein